MAKAFQDSWEDLSDGFVNDDVPGLIQRGFIPVDDDEPGTVFNGVRRDGGRRVDYKRRPQNYA